jgi:hypothetical protein
MRLKDGLILIVLSLGLGWVVVSATTPTPIQLQTDSTVVDTPVILNVKNKTALFIGDSHTANHTNGWQKVLTMPVGDNLFQY